MSEEHELNCNENVCFTHKQAYTKCLKSELAAANARIEAIMKESWKDEIWRNSTLFGIALSSYGEFLDEIWSKSPDGPEKVFAKIQSLECEISDLKGKLGKAIEGINIGLDHVGVIQHGNTLSKRQRLEEILVELRRDLKGKK